MTISDLKNSVDIVQIASELGLKLDSKGKCLCPFHKEKTASLQFSKQKQIATCFSGNCDAGTMDVIDLVKKFYSWDVPQAMQWLKSYVNKGSYSIVDATTTQKKEDYNTVFNTLVAKLKSSTKAKNYLQSRHIDYEKVAVGYNTGIYKQLKYCVVFPLKNKSGGIVSLYGRSVVPNAKSKHYYTAGRTGLYPCYPDSKTRHLFLTESILDAITLQQHFVLSEGTTILAAYGTNGLTPEHVEAIRRLKELEEVTFFFDGDGAGLGAIKKYAAQLHKINSKLTISKAPIIDNEDVNSLLDTHESQILQHLYDKRITIHSPVTLADPAPLARGLVIKPNYAVYEDKQLKIELMGGVDMKDLSKLKVTTIIHNNQIPAYPPSRNHVDLYNDDQIEKLVRKVAMKIEVNTGSIQTCLLYTSPSPRDLSTSRMPSSA